MKTCSQCQVKYPDALAFCPKDGTPLPASSGEGGEPDPFIGATIDGRYTIETRLGEGGMGVVYKARHAIIDKTVAIKILRAEAAQDGASVKRFLQEARSASKINHSNIVDITDYGEIVEGQTYGHAYFVMEFLEGPTLAQVLQEGPLDGARVCHIAAQMARGLYAAHQKGIVHRDLKPENVFLLTREGQADCVKIVDFGIAKVGTGQRLTQVGMVLGTPEYMSPEQATGQETDHRVDQYALGCMMYEMLTGVVPFLGERPAQTLTKHVFEPVVPLRQRKPELNISPALEAVVLRTMEKKPDRRFPSLRELEIALSQVEGDLRSGRVVVDEGRLYPTPAPPLNEAVTYPSMPAFSGPPAAIPMYGPSTPFPPSQPTVPAMSMPGVPPAYAPQVSGGMAVPQALPQQGYGSAPVYPSPVALTPYVPPRTPAPGEGRPTVESLSTQQSRRTRAILAGLGGVAVAVLGVVGYVLFFMPRPQPQVVSSEDLRPVVAPPVAPLPVPQPPVEVAPPPVPKGPVKIVIRTRPRDAELFVDATRLGSTPYELIRERGSEFVLELRKKGYLPHIQRISADQDQDAAIDLLRVEGKGRRKGGRGERKEQAERNNIRLQPTPPPPTRPNPTGTLRNPFGGGATTPGQPAPPAQPRK